jgi:hypothetical protein
MPQQPPFRQFHLGQIQGDLTIAASSIELAEERLDVGDLQGAQKRLQDAQVAVSRAGWRLRDRYETATNR